MQLTDFLNTDRYVRRKGADTIVMPHPVEVVEAFRQSSDQEIEVRPSKPVTIQEMDGTEHTTYREYILTTKVPGFDILDHYANIGAVINLERDLMIVYAGWEAWACTNLCTFGADEDHRLDNVNLTELNVMAQKAVAGIADQSKAFTETVERLNDRKYPNKVDFFRRMGELIMKDDNIWSYLRHADSQFRDPNSIYYDWEDTDWKMLSGMTDAVKNKRPTQQIQHTRSLQNLFV